MKEPKNPIYEDRSLNKSYMHNQGIIQIDPKSHPLDAAHTGRVHSG